MQSSFTSAQPPLGIALVGTGFGQKVHLPALQHHPATQVVAVYHRDLAKAKAIAAAHEIPQACDAIAALVALPEVDAVSLSTPPFLHDQMAKEILEGGKHLLLEKPTTMSATTARELYKLAQAQNLRATLNFEFRYVPAWMRLQELLAQGYVGQKRLIKIDWLVAGRADPHRPWSWHASKALGGGALGALASHTFDYISWLFGPIKQLCARLNVAIPFRPDPVSGLLKAVDAEDTCTLLLELNDGTPCQVAISFATYQGRGHWVEVYGDRGTLILGSSNQQDYVHGFQLLGSQGGAPLAEMPIPERLAFRQTYPDGRIAPVQRIVDRWVESIHRGQTLGPSLREGTYSQLLMDLAQESHVSGCRVQVPDLDEFLQA